MTPSANSATSELPDSYEKAPTRRERRRAETRERIIRHALRLFSERGVTATTVEDITDAADVGKGTFFNYFPSKEHILAHLCKLQMGKIKESVAQAVDSTEPMDRVMYRIALTLAEKFEASPSLVQSILVPSLSSDSMRRQMAEDLKKSRLVVAELIAARQERGELRKDLAPVALALQFQRALFGTTVLWSLDRSQPLSACLKEMITVLWSGIRREGPCGMGRGLPGQPIRRQFPGVCMDNGEET